MKLPGTCSLLKESHNKKIGLLFLRGGTPTFWLGLLLFIKRKSRTPTENPGQMLKIILKSSKLLSEHLFYVQIMHLYGFVL